MTGKPLMKKVTKMTEKPLIQKEVLWKAVGVGGGVNGRWLQRKRVREAN